ncbi:hypothetical protein BJX99DRAFT_243088 [Aspergillus californicus]
MYVLPVSITLVGVATTVVALRLFTRIRLVYAPGWDDWILLLALIADWAFFGVLLAEHSYGLGKPESSLSPETYRNQLKMLWISIPLYNLSLNLTKVSMVLLYLRLFPTRTYRIILLIVLTLIICAGIYMVLGTLLICLPVNAFWDFDIEHTCTSRAVVWYLTAGLQITGDLILVVLPMPQLVRLQIPLRQKLCLMLIFALGLFVCATSIARLLAINVLLHSQDFSRGNGLAAVWSVAETNTAIICASLPTFRQLLGKICPPLLPSFGRNSADHDKRLPPMMLWQPYQGPARYSASVSASADRDSISQRTDGIQVVRELRWEMGSAAREGDEESGPAGGSVDVNQANLDRVSNIQKE